jgi:hypothetical protein
MADSCTQRKLGNRPLLYQSFSLANLLINGPGVPRRVFFDKCLYSGIPCVREADYLSLDMLTRSLVSLGVTQCRDSRDT